MFIIIYGSFFRVYRKPVTLPFGRLNDLPFTFFRLLWFPDVTSINVLQYSISLTVAPLLILVLSDYQTEYISITLFYTYYMFKGVCGQMCGAEAEWLI